MLSQKHHCDYMKQRAVHLRKGLVMIVVWLVCFHNESQAQKLVAIPETSLIMYGTVRNTANRNAQIISGTLVCRREDAWRDKPGTITPASGSPVSVTSVAASQQNDAICSGQMELWRSADVPPLRLSTAADVSRLHLICDLWLETRYLGGQPTSARRGSLAYL